MASFQDLTRALDRRHATGTPVRFWWRDDDATEPSPSLIRLLALSDAFQTEVAVAVIPARATDELPSALRARGRVAVLQHGYAHSNHAPPGAPAIECGGRAEDEVLADLEQGRVRMLKLFGAIALPILAAPWNRIDPGVLARLVEAGFEGASAYGPRMPMRKRSGIAVANAHVDPMNWRTRRFTGNEKALSAILGELAERIERTDDADEPIGLLTHHLDHDEALWTFLEEFLSATHGHPAVHWITTAEAFGLPAGATVRVGGEE